MNILIAEDEKDIRKLISLHMRKENYDVYEAADDYLVKPISPIELSARVASNLRRCYSYTEHKDIIYITGELKLFTETFEIYKGKKRIELNSKEFKIVKLLITNF